MTMFQKPKVEIAFTPHEDVEEPALELPASEQWAHTPARRWFLATLLTLLCIGTFVYPTYNGELLPGDDPVLRSNPLFAQLSPPRNFWDGLGYDVRGLAIIWGSPQKLPELSPVSYSVLLIEHQFFGLGPRGYHIISILLHARNALLLWLLLRRLELPGAFLGAALFALHPVQVDAVSWISQQRYLVCGAFYFCALLVYLRRAGLNPQPAPPLPGAEPLIHFGLPENPKRLYALSISLFLLAVLSHALGVTFPLVVLVLIWWERGRIKRDDVIPLIPFAAIGAVFVLLSAMLAYHRSGTLWIAFPGPLNWIPLWGRGLWSYFLMTILPIHLAFARSRWDADSMRPWHWLLPFAAMVVLAALWTLRRRWGRGPLTAALLFICLLLPSALGGSDPNDIDLPGVMIREHVLYLACAAVLVPLATLLVQALTSAKLRSALAVLPNALLSGAVAAAVPAASILILLGLASLTFVHTFAYHDENSLWENVLNGDRDSSVALNTLGQIELQKEDYGGAERHFLTALRAKPDDTVAQLNLARAEESEKQYDDAIARYDEVLVRHPDNVEAHFGKGEVLAAEGESRQALDEYNTVEKLDPHNVLVLNNIGLIVAQQGDLDAAIDEYKKAISMDARNMPAYLNLANAYFQKGSYLDARDTLEKALAVDPHNYVAWLNAGVMAEAVNDMASAEKYFRNAIVCKYDSADAWNDLGLVLMKRGDAPGRTDRVGEAVYCFKRAAELDPTNPSYERNRQMAQQQKDRILQQQQQQ
jgi:protein O-mannosyl-transferase